MILLINTSNLAQGGIVQGSLSFLEEIKNYRGHTFHVFLADCFSRQLILDSYPENFYFYSFKHLPLSVFYGFSMRARLRKLEKAIKPDCVLSISGPSYWRPTNVHLIGFARGHYVYSDYFEKINYSLFEDLSFKVKKVFHRFLFKREADYYFTQTNDVSERLSKFINIEKNRVFTVGNTYHPIFNKVIHDLQLLPPSLDGEFRLITIADYHKHKNLEVINEIIPYLVKENIRVKFILTLPSAICKKKFGRNMSHIINVGPVAISSCPYLYSQSNALFLPTLIECFSASYPEAMKMGKPILTSDLSFAHDICKEAAIYFDPLNPENIAESIISISKDIELRKKIVNKGYERLSEFETSQSRAKRYIDICELISRD